MCYTGRCPLEYMSGDCRLVNSAHCLQEWFPLDQSALPEWLLTKGYLYCLHVNTIKLEDYHICLDCNSIINHISI